MGRRAISGRAILNWRPTFSRCRINLFEIIVFLFENWWFFVFVWQNFEREGVFSVIWRFWRPTPASIGPSLLARPYGSRGGPFFFGGPLNFYHLGHQGNPCAGSKIFFENAADNKIFFFYLDSLESTLNVPGREIFGCWARSRRNCVKIGFNP